MRAANVLAALTAQQNKWKSFFRLKTVSRPSVQTKQRKKKSSTSNLFLYDEKAQKPIKHTFSFYTLFSPLSTKKIYKWKKQNKKHFSPDLCPSDFIQEKKNQTTNITQLPVSYLPSFLKK